MRKEELIASMITAVNSDRKFDTIADYKKFLIEEFERFTIEENLKDFTADKILLEHSGNLRDVNIVTIYLVDQSNKLTLKSRIMKDYFDDFMNLLFHCFNVSYLDEIPSKTVKYIVADGEYYLFNPNEYDYSKRMLSFSEV